MLIALAQLDSSTDQYSQAESLYKEAADIQKIALGEQTEQYAATLDALATLYVSMGHNQQAEVLYLQALALEKKTVGEQQSALRD